MKQLTIPNKNNSDNSKLKSQYYAFWCSGDTKSYFISKWVINMFLEIFRATCVTYTEITNIKQTSILPIS